MPLLSSVLPALHLAGHFTHRFSWAFVTGGKTNSVPSQSRTPFAGKASRVSPPALLRRIKARHRRPPNISKNTGTSGWNREDRESPSVDERFGRRPAHFPHRIPAPRVTEKPELFPRRRGRRSLVQS